MGISGNLSGVIMHVVFNILILAIHLLIKALYCHGHLQQFISDQRWVYNCNLH